MRTLAILFVLSACSASAPDPVVDDAGSEASAPDAVAEAAIDAIDANDASTDADASNGCFESTGVWGACMSTTDCAALGAYTSTPGLCPGPSSIQCCAPTPNVADNPPIPAGWTLMQQANVTPAMTSWAVAILKDPVTYPMFSTTTQTFGTLPVTVMARVEWHPPDFQNSVVHRGVTLYQQ